MCSCRDICKYLHIDPSQQHVLHGVAAPLDKQDVFDLILSLPGTDLASPTSDHVTQCLGIKSTIITWNC